ncbi:MAG: TonB-dependent receptor [Saprospiraceae bacterium]|nr:TonB-dependent receptor [Saprospiraceae bacterium]
MKRQLFLAFLGISISLNVWGQSNIITGKITDTKGEALIGAVIIVQGTTAGTISDIDGNYSIMAKPNSNLIVSILGYITKVVNVGNESNISIVLEEGNVSLEDVVVVGSRRPNRLKTETPVPIDVLNTSMTQFPTSKMDITSMLNFAAPSFNYNKQSGSDGADHIDLATLRGLGPDQTLVLINGKRRHQTAYVSVFGSRGRGSSGTDLNAIPQSSIDRIEILRDGASAQYGSDAIAGVMNIILKQNTGKLTGHVGYGAHIDNKYNTIKSKDQGYNEYKGNMDGNTFSTGLSYGWKLAKTGFLNVSADFNTIDKTYRQDPDKTLPFNIYRRAHGEGSMTGGGVMLNLEAPIKNAVTFYAFGGWNNKKSDAFAFTRRFADNPERFPTDANGNIIIVNDIIKTTTDSQYYYNPHIQTVVNDIAATAGLKGNLKNGWDWDLSHTYGKNDFHFYGDKTFNASLGANQTHFDDGGFSFAQNTTNLNLGKEYDWMKGFHLGLGAEFRKEDYNLYAGEEASYKNYNPNKPSGAQGFPGYQPGDEVDASRNTIGVYAEGELDITNAWLANAAVRFENYSDFGSTFNYKLASRYKINKNINIRGSFSTGFRAPSLQQINFSSTFTTVQGGTISEVKIAPNYSSITKIAGIPELKQEESTNASLGFNIKLAEGLSLSIDGYQVGIKDRVVLSGQFSAGDTSLSPSLLNIMDSLKVGFAQFFANAVNTTNRGIDIVLDYSKSGDYGNIRGLFTANFQNMKIDEINVPASLNTSPSNKEYFYSIREQYFLLASAPESKFALSLEYGKDKWNIGTRLNYFGKINLYGYGDFNTLLPEVPLNDGSKRVPDLFNYKSKIVNDLFFSYKIIKGATLYLGVDNVFNVHPELGYVPGASDWAYNNETGGPWDAVQMGGNGRKWFARVGFSF